MNRKLNKPSSERTPGIFLLNSASVKRAIGVLTLGSDGVTDVR